MQIKLNALERLIKELKTSANNFGAQRFGNHIPLTGYLILNRESLSHSSFSTLGHDLESLISAL